nr:hypothetical protein [uncultured Blautia sp.]
MKKTILFIGLFVILGLTACGANKEKTLEDIIVGNWKIEEYEDDEFVFSEDGKLSANGMDLGFYSVSENTLEINYTTDGSKVTELAKVYGEDEFAIIYVKEKSAEGDEINQRSYDENHLRFIRKS